VPRHKLAKNHLNGHPVDDANQKSRNGSGNGVAPARRAQRTIDPLKTALGFAQPRGNRAGGRPEVRPGNREGLPARPAGNRRRQPPRG
jgi:hypothetical protein